MLTLPPVFDVLALLPDLERREKFVAKVLRQYLDVTSARTDLALAHELLVVIIHDEEEALPRSVRAACLAQVILLYARALIVKNVGRSRFDIRPKLTRTQAEIHDCIRGYRHQAVAHFDPLARHEDALFADERLLFPDDDTFRLIAFTRRLAIRDSLVRELVEVTEAALVIMDAMIEEKVEAARGAFRDLLRRDPRWFQRLREERVDLNELELSFGDAADMLGQGLNAGRVLRR